MFRKGNVFIILVWVLMLIFTVSCNEDQKTELILKDEDDTQVLLHNTETITINNVKVTVSSDAWSGAPRVREKVTPLKLSVENKNENPIKVTYENLKLVSKDGDVFSALPIYNIIGELDKAHLDPNEKVIVKEGIDYDRFYIYPMYNNVYSNIPVTNVRYFENPNYYKRYYAEWEGTGMPTDDMRNLALPEGILDKGGMLSGFVYFQKVDPDLKQVTLNMDIINAENNEVLGSINLPFWVMYETE